MPRRPVAAPLHGGEVAPAIAFPRASGAARRFAAATASWIARLMPTPPTGDMACAASPMHSRPGRHQRRSRSTAHGEQLHLAPSRRARRRDRRGTARARTSSSRNAWQARAAAPLDRRPSDHVGALPVVAAVQHDDEAARPKMPPRRSGIGRATRQAKPQHVHRRAEIVAPAALRASRTWSGGRRRRRRDRRGFERAVRRCALHAGDAAVVARSGRSPRLPCAGRKPG